MKKILTLTIGLIFTLMLSAQKNISIEVSEPYAKPQSNNLILRGEKFTIDSKIYQIKYPNKKIEITKLDEKTNNEELKTEYEYQNNKSKIFSMIFGSEIYVFYSEKNKNTKKHELFAQKVNRETCVLDPNVIKLISSDTKNDWPINDINTLANSNSTKLLIYFTLKNKDEKSLKEEVGMFLFDEKLNKLGGDIYELPKANLLGSNFKLYYNPYLNSYGKIILDVNGNFYKLIKENNNYSTIKVNTIDNKIEVTPVNINTSSENYEKKKIINTILLKKNNKDEIICAGVYKNEDGPDFEGLFIVNISNPTSKQLYYPIPKNIQSQYEPKNPGDNQRDNASIDILNIDNIRYFEDGSMIINAEHNYAILKTNSNTGMDFLDDHYRYILATKINKDGTLAWMRKVPRYQYRVNASNFRYFKMGSKHYYFFLDNIKNENLTESMDPARHMNDAGGWLTAYIIDDNSGIMKRETLFNIDDIKGFKLVNFGIYKLQDSPKKTITIESEINEQNRLIQIILKLKE